MASKRKTVTVSNTSGIQPLDLRVLVKPDEVETKTKGGILLPEPAVDQQKYAMQKATIVAVGENAWEEAAARSPAFVRPQPGDRVLIAKYGGVRVKGLDEVEYILMNDEDVIGRLEERA
jgi:chaperonin GroES